MFKLVFTGYSVGIKIWFNVGRVFYVAAETSIFLVSMFLNSKWKRRTGLKRYL